MTAGKELFIVEGKSAASTIQQAMHKQSQCVLAIQGKFLNAAKAKLAKVKANEECQKLFRTLGCGVGDDCNPDKLNYSQILILTDPDVDGAHSRALVLSLFDHYLRPLVDSGMISIIIPPLFRLSGKQAGKKRYAWSEQERGQLIEKMDKASDIDVTRFKGVAQFSQEECVQLFLQPETRKQIELG